MHIHDCSQIVSEHWLTVHRQTLLIQQAIWGNPLAGIEPYVNPFEQNKLICPLLHCNCYIEHRYDVFCYFIISTASNEFRSIAKTSTVLDEEVQTVLKHLLKQAKPTNECEEAF